MVGVSVSVSVSFVAGGGAEDDLTGEEACW